MAEQGDAADAARRSAAAEHPMVQAILKAFPGARIDAVRDEGTDAYGLPPQASDPMPADAPDFAPPDADDAEGPPEDWE